MAAPAYHFTAESVSDSVFADFQSLNKLTEKIFNEVSKVVLEFLVQPRQSSRFVDDIQAIAERGKTDEQYLCRVTKSLLLFVNSAATAGLTSQQVAEDLSKLGLSADKSAGLSKQFSSCSDRLAPATCSTGQSSSVSRLTDLEWKFGVTAASSEMNKVGNTFLQMKLVINKGTGSENVYMELTLPQFYKFLHEMEKAKASVEYFS